MKKLFSLLILLAVISGSCTKEYVNPTQQDDPTGGSGNGGGSGGGGGGGGGGGSSISPVPATFSQKVLIEEFTGEWCGYCPDGALKLEDAQNAHPGKVYGASVHQGDFMENTLYTTLNNTFSVTGFPNGMVQRLPAGSTTMLDRGAWSGAASGLLAMSTTPCGLAMTSYTVGTDSMYVEVHCGFNTTLAGDYRLTIYLLEDGVPADHQSNYYNTPGAQNPDEPALNNIGDPITVWEHDDVVRKIMTSDLGDAIPASKLVPGGEHIAKYGTTITGYTKANLKITAFVNKVGTDALTHQIMNVQQAGISVIKDWD
jgi:Outer membrane protein Omp28